ncbi:14893_t:CDS:2, partial [Funneliformis caledonium]
MAQMILNCFILGDTHGFSVVLGEKIIIKNTIPFENFNVALLIDYIWEKKKDIISRHNIDLWKVEIEETDENIEKLKNTEINIRREFESERLSTTKLAKNIFSVGPPDETTNEKKALWKIDPKEISVIQSKNEVQQ